MEPTARALELGQADTLLVSTGLAPDTAEDLIHRAETTRTHVEFVPKGDAVLEGLGGVGALLRYRVTEA
jgi:peptide subunit release factor 1 (eRF1)